MVLGACEHGYGDSKDSFTAHGSKDNKMGIVPLIEVLRYKLWMSLAASTLSKLLKEKDGWFDIGGVEGQDNQNSLINNIDDDTSVILFYLYVGCSDFISEVKIRP
ncbi:hypothetical protein FRX31_035458 [Thalictrum thalictroides]|uniref:Uncharacterized protein n=1 Tax=Thalictrum thalictroides TaxID=46969 RepID=A0A7J6UR07_THATH|nr:hypothetical protein FRX31_035458 [Thalictrum thalictroides]